MNRLYNKYKQSVIINRFVNLFSIDILIKASSFILLPVYLKLMTQTEFGLFNYLVSIVGFFAQILNFGLYLAQSKIYQELESDQKGAFVFTLQMTLLMLFVPSVLIIYIFHLDNYVIELLFKNPIDYATFRFPILLAIVASVYSFMLSNFLLSSEKIRQVQRYNVIRLVLLNITVLAVLFFLNDKVNARLIATYTVELSLVVIFFYYMIKEMKPKFNKIQMYRSVKIGFPVMSAAICGVVVNFGDKFLLERHGGFVDLSVYYLAFSVGSFIPLLFNTFQNIWLPIFLKERNLEKNIARTNKMIYTLAGGYIILSIFMVVIIKIALNYNLIDKKYSGILLILPIILVSLIIDSITHLYINYITLFEKTWILPIFSVIIGIGSIISNIILIGSFGLYGAAYSSLLINLFGFIMFYCLFKFKLSKNAIVSIV
jgi:O-antigen/teichoic acid export membrane protein